MILVLATMSDKNVDGNNNRNGDDTDSGSVAEAKARCFHLPWPLRTKCVEDPFQWIAIAKEPQ